MMDLLCFILLAAFFPVSETWRRHWNAIEGEAFVVKCPTSNSFVTWHLAGMNITTDKGAQVHSSGNQLWFLPASPKHSGMYTCTLMRASSSSEPKTLNVTINPRKEGICYYEDTLYSDIKGSLGSGKIYCPSVDNYKNASDFKWYKDCKELHESRYKADGEVLSIANANVNDNGNYTCQFTYRHGGRNFTVSATRGFRIAKVSPLKPLEVLYPKPNQVIYVEIGRPLNLSCKAWLGDGKQIVAGSYWKYNKGKIPKPFVTYSQLYMVHNEGLFTEAILSTKKVRQEHIGLNFTCHMFNAKGFKRISVTLSEDQSKDHSNTYLIIVFSILLVVITLLGMLYHFFRIDIVLLYRRIFNRSECKEDGKIYDAYVIYPTNYVNGTYENNFMGSFVHQILLDVLEKKCGYKLCIYGRDVLPGEDVINAVEKRIQKSRRVILLLTQCLAKGGCFLYEHQIALYNALIQNVKVILLEMENIGEYAQLQDSLRHLIHQQGTIKWKAKYMAHPSSPDSAFWKHVKYHMPPKRPHAIINPI